MRSRHLELGGLVRAEQPAERAADAARRLLGVVSEWGPATGLEVTLSHRRGRTRCRVHLCGTVPRGWRADLDWALAPLGALRPVTGRADVLPGGQVLELRTTWRPTSPIASLDLDTGHNSALAAVNRQERNRTEPPRPQPRYADLARVLEAAPASGLVLRHQLAGTEQIEREMLADDLCHTWPGSDAEWHSYAGTPVRLRTLVAAYAGPVPARVRTMLREWGSWLELDPVDPLDADVSWALTGPGQLAGLVRAERAALVTLRLPAAGPQGFPGTTTAVPEHRLTPLDPVPARPPAAVRLGRARTIHGQWTDVEVGLRDLMQHAFVQGASGSGKSTLLAALCRAVQDAGGSYTLIDPEGSTVDALIAQTPRHHADLVRVVRHGDPALDAPLNLLADGPAGVEAKVALFAEMVQRSQDPRLSGMVGPRWHRWFTLLALGVHAHLGSRATLVAVAAVASDMGRVRRLALALRESHPELSHRLSSEYGSLRDAEAADLVSWGVSKLGPLVASADLRWILGAGPDSLDVPAMMDSGESLAVDLGSHRIGGPAAETLGAVHLLKHWAALGVRQHRDRPHVIVVDEAHRLGHGPLPQLFAEARKFGVGVVAATQHLGQLSGELADALESNTGAFVSLRSGLQSADRASVRLGGWPVSDLVRLPNLTAVATLSAAGVMGEPFSLVLDQHERNSRDRRAGTVGQDVAERILLQSSAELNEPYRDVDPLSDADLMASLAPRLPGPEG